VAAGRARKHHASEHGSEKKPAGQQATRHRLDNESNPAPLLANLGAHRDAARYVIGYRRDTLERKCAAIRTGGLAATGSHVTYRMKYPSAPVEKEDHTAKEKCQQYRHTNRQ
jgi:hypothetical protein